MNRSVFVHYLPYLPKKHYITSQNHDDAPSRAPIFKGSDMPCKSMNPTCITCIKVSDFLNTERKFYHEIMHVICIHVFTCNLSIGQILFENY